MALVAASPVVVQVEAKVWALFYGDVVVCVEVCLIAMPSLSQLIEDDACGWFVNAIRSGVFDNVRFPSAIDALPTISLEALDAEPVMVTAVASLSVRGTLLVTLLLTDGTA
jgi:hypothetical protein